MSGQRNSVSPDMQRHDLTLGDLKPGMRVRGIVPSGPVTIRQVEDHGHAVTVTYADDTGHIEERLYLRDHAPALWLDASSRRYAFDGDPTAFRLAAEALRIRMAALFDDMLAVATSDLEPLPHQIRAVYGELLPRTPLRFLLADDPGAGKTIMAGLYIKELMLRGDLERCLIVAPGSLVEQWRDELAEKFDLRFEILTPSLAEAAPDGAVFDQQPLLIARMDQLARSQDLTAALEKTDWDLIVIDEAHRMSARYYKNELRRTLRYKLGQLLGRITRHFLLMTATPHNGNEASFQAFMALLDPDRFEGRYREGVHTVTVDDLMRRMIKEDLLTFDGRPLFPERIAETIAYQLSPAERDLYEAVTQYVREEMNRADRLKQEGDRPRGTTVGFALTVLQRRLASSPEAILRSLERRRARLQQRRQEILTAQRGGTDRMMSRRLAELLGRDSGITDEDLDDLTPAEREQVEDQVVDAASAARTIAELDAEIAVLGSLVELARRVRVSDTDRKWTELRTLLLDEESMYAPDGTRRKIVIFTEHRDTLNYLLEKIRDLLGRDDAVVAIHGGVDREARRAAQELFTQDKGAHVLVATDAAGEGLNLQRAHLMVNYDLPWNPNRIEQRFGRIHRIGQTEVCRLWNLVAADTREGAVFARLLRKAEQQRRSLNGKVFDVLGKTFEDRSLRDVLLEAIRYGDQPEVRARLNQVIDEEVSKGLDKLMAERALHRQTLAATDVEELRLQMEEARARRLQPHFIEAFFTAAFARFGGTMSPREFGRYEITHVPEEVRERCRQIRPGAPVVHRYERVCFDRERVRVPGKPTATLLAPGHPLLDAVVDLTIARHRALLKQGTILIDGNDPGEQPRLLVAIQQEIVDGHEPARTVSKRFDFVELLPDGTAQSAGPAPYLDYRPPRDDEKELVGAVRDEPWLAEGAEKRALSWAIRESLPAHFEEVRQRVTHTVTRVRREVERRLTQEINYWYGQVAELKDKVEAGQNPEMRPETAEARAQELERRLDKRKAALERDAALQPKPPVVAGVALVVPYGMIERLAGRRDGPVSTYAKHTAEVEQRAVEAVVAAERRLGREPEVLPRNNRGFDIRSRTPDGHYVFIEVKGRMSGADVFTVTRSEVLLGKNADRYRLALVSVSPDGPEHDEVRYVVEPFRGVSLSDFAVTAVSFNWHEMWARGGEPV